MTRTPDLRPAEKYYTYKLMVQNIPVIRARTEEYLKDDTKTEDRKISVKIQTFDRLEQLCKIAEKKFTKKQCNVIFELAFN